MSNKIYDILKWVALVMLDAVGLFYQTLAEIWSLPYGDNVLKTCVALSVLIGTLIGVSGTQYNRTDNESRGYEQYKQMKESEDFIGEDFDYIEEEGDEDEVNNL